MLLELEFRSEVQAPAHISSPRQLVVKAQVAHKAFSSWGLVTEVTSPRHLDSFGAHANTHIPQLVEFLKSLYNMNKAAIYKS